MIHMKHSTPVVKSNLKLQYLSQLYILVKGTILVAAVAAVERKNDKDVIFKKCAKLTDCIREINNAQIDNAKDIDAVLSMFNLKEYSDNYSKTSGSFWHYYRDGPAFANGAIVDFPDNNNNSVLFINKK